jgi:hypothetical protein
MTLIVRGAVAVAAFTRVDVTLAGIDSAARRPRAIAAARTPHHGRRFMRR